MLYIHRKKTEVASEAIHGCMLLNPLNRREPEMRRSSHVPRPDERFGKAKSGGLHLALVVSRDSGKAEYLARNQSKQS